MKTKSILGFVLGLIGLLLSIAVSIYSYFVLAIIFAVAKTSFIYYIALYANLISNIIIIIGLCFYFTKARIGGIIMIVAFVLNIFVFVMCLTINQIFLSVLPLVIIAIIPSILLLISSVLGLKTKHTISNE